MYDSDVVSLSIREVVHETELAILFQGKYGKFWLPKSTIVSMSENSVEYYDFVDVDFIDD